MIIPIILVWGKDKGLLIPVGILTAIVIWGWDSF